MTTKRRLQRKKLLQKSRQEDHAKAFRLLDGQAGTRNLFVGRFRARWQTDWTGVRNFQARNNLRNMKVGDRVLFYHSGTGKCVVGIAEVAKAGVS